MRKAAQGEATCKRWKRLAVGGWGHREAARAARGAAPTSMHGRVADASLPESAEDEGEEGEGQDDDDDEAAAIGPAAIDTALPLVPEFPFGAHFVRS